MKQYKYLIVGSGLTGDAAVRGIRELDADGSIGMFSMESDPPYARPNLSKGLWKDRPMEKVWRNTQDLGLEMHLGRKVVHLDSLGKCVRDERGVEYSFDKILLAMGGSVNRLLFGGEDIIYFRDLQDYHRLRALSDHGEKFLVIGGGFIGSEIAAALTMSGTKVVMVFPEESIGADVFPNDLSYYLNDYYRQKGVEVVTNDVIVSLEKNGSRLTVEDIQMVADELGATHDQTDGRDGFVSIEVSPTLAHDTTGTIEEAHRLWSLVDRANAMIKVPATREGLPAIQQLTAEGVNVNITLLFGLPRYRQVVDAYLTGLESLASTRKNLKNVASVASFFLSRIDTLVDPVLEKKMAAGGLDASVAARLKGQVATASAKAAYQMYKEIFGGDRFRKLQDRGARTQKLLWASTSTKNPAYNDTKYIEPLIGPDTINTLPIETLDAYRDHGLPRRTLDENPGHAYQILQGLPRVGISLDQIAQDLEEQGVEKFRVAVDRLMASLQEKQTSTPTSV